LLPFEDRFTRQRQLPQVGIAGQLRIEAMRVVTCADASGLIEATYLERAGAASVERSTSQLADDFPHAGHFEFEVTRVFAQGAHRALARIRHELSRTDQP